MGVYLDAATLVRNRQIVEDEVFRLVFRLANGFVERYETISEENQGNEVVGQYRVWVRTGQLSNEIRTRVNQNRIIVDMGQLVTSANSELERNRQINVILQSFISDFPGKAITATVVGFGLAEPAGLTNDVIAYVDVALQWNQIWLYRFASLLQHANIPGSRLRACNEIT